MAHCVHRCTGRWRRESRSWRHASAREAYPLSSRTHGSRAPPRCIRACYSSRRRGGHAKGSTPAFPGTCRHRRAAASRILHTQLARPESDSPHMRRRLGERRSHQAWARAPRGNRSLRSPAAAVHPTILRHLATPDI